MRHWKPREAMKRPLLSPSGPARAYRSAQVETFGGYQLADYGRAKELMAPRLDCQARPFSNRSYPKTQFGVEDTI
jgi:hypothetical protein